VHRRRLLTCRPRRCHLERTPRPRECGFITQNTHHNAAVPLRLGQPVQVSRTPRWAEEIFTTDCRTLQPIGMSPLHLRVPPLSLHGTRCRTRWRAGQQNTTVRCGVRIGQSWSHGVRDPALVCREIRRSCGCPEVEHDTFCLLNQGRMNMVPSLLPSFETFRTSR